MRQVPSWARYHLDKAVQVSKRSKDPVTQVGCVIVEPGSNHTLSEGFNGFPPGIVETEERWSKPDKHDFVIHAEINAICHSRSSLRGSHAFITHEPCLSCAKALIAAGVAEVHFLHSKPDDKASQLLAEAKIPCWHLPL